MSASAPKSRSPSPAAPIRGSDALRALRSWTPSLGFSRTIGSPEPLQQTSEYSILGLAGSADQQAVRRQRLAFGIALFGVATVIGLLYTMERYLYSRMVGGPFALGAVVPVALVFTYTWAALAPVVMMVARRFPVWRRWSQGNALVLLVALVAFVSVHVGIISLAAVVVAPGITIDALGQVFWQSLLSWTVLDAIVFCSIVVLHHAVVYYRVSRDRALRASQLEARLAQAQLQMLRMQLQPHFLFNTLHSISALMHRDVRRADSMVAALSDLLRMSLQNIGAQEVPLQSELEFLDQYVEIMRLRFGDRLRVAVDVDPEARDARVPNLFLQPLVENSFRHGFGDLGQGSITIVIRRDGDMLHCEVADDGRGLRANHKEGVGLSSTRQRLAHLYGDRHTFTLQGAPGQGVRVTMRIPFTPNETATADR